MKTLNTLIDFLSEFIAQRKGLLPLLGAGLILINLVVQFLPVAEWLQTSNLFLHLGIVIAILGFLLAWAL